MHAGNIVSRKVVLLHCCCLYVPDAAWCLLIICHYLLFPICLFLFCCYWIARTFFSDTCNCHEFGSNGVLCDPVNFQCDCKPGVIGKSCHQCKPNWWGISLIGTKNNLGCLRKYLLLDIRDGKVFWLLFWEKLDRVHLCLWHILPLVAVNSPLVSVIYICVRTGTVTAFHGGQF